MENEANNKNKKYDESRVYYVYKHVRLDNNTCFYIGKGKNGRKDYPNRNPTHDSICEKHGYKVVTIKKGLNEKEAFKLEVDLINCYAFKMGYGICIKGHMNNNNKFLTNMTWGGDGVSGYKHSEEYKKMMSEAMKGEKNPMFGKNAYANKTEEEMKIIRKKMSERTKGEKNPMFRKNQYANKTPEEIEIIRRKMSEAHEGKEMSEEQKQKISKKVICITTGEEFNSIKYAGYHYGIAPDTISACCKGKRKSSGVLNHVPLQWKYAEDDDNESKQKMSKAYNKKVVCITTGKTFDSIKEASDNYDVAQSGILRCCKGKLKSSGKLPNGVRLQWKYSEDDNNDLKVV